MADAKNIEELLQALASGDDESREEAASALVGTDDPRALMPLMAAAKDAHPGVKYFAKKALKTLQEKMAEAAGLDEPDEAPPPSAAKPGPSPAPPAPKEPPPAMSDFDEMFAAIAGGSPPAAPPEKAPAPKAAPEPESDPAAAPASEASAEDATGEDGAGKGMEADVREKIQKIQEIAESGNRAKLPMLLKLLEAEKDKFLLATLVKAVGKLGDKSHMDAILHLLKDSDTRVVANAIEALETLGNPKAVESVIKLISHADNRVRANAMKMVWTFAHNNALASKLIMDRLKDMIFSSKPVMRESAIFVLGEIGTPAALDLVSDSVADSVESVRLKAQEAIKKIEEKIAASGKPLIQARRVGGPGSAPKAEAPAEAEDAEERGKELKAEAPRKAAKPSPVAKAASSGGDEAFLDIDKSKVGAKQTVMIGVTQSAANKNPMRTVMKVSIAVSLVVALIAGGLVWHTGGDLNKIGIPYNMFPVSEAPVEKAEETLGPKTGFEVSLKDGKAYLDEGFYDEAIKEFLVCLKEKPNHPEAKRGVAEARYKRGEEYTNLEIFDKALEEFKKCLEFADPGSETAKQAEDKIKRLSERVPK